jgi:hypothetical protein
MSDVFHDFQFNPHFDHDGHLSGYTQKDMFGDKHYFGNEGHSTGHAVKDPFTHHSDYYDSNNKHIGHNIKDINGHDFLKSDGSLGHTPKMFELKDPNFHNDVHNHFSSYRAHLLGKIG